MNFLPYRKYVASSTSVSSNILHTFVTNQKAVTSPRVASREQLSPSISPWRTLHASTQLYVKSYPPCGFLVRQIFCESVAWQLPCRRVECRNRSIQRLPVAHAKRPIVTVSHSCGVVVSVGHDCDACKNGWTDRAAVCWVDFGGPMQLCIR